MRAAESARDGSIQGLVGDYQDSGLIDTTIGNPKNPDRVHRVGVHEMICIFKVIL